MHIVRAVSDLILLINDDDELQLKADNMIHLFELGVYLYA